MHKFVLIKSGKKPSFIYLINVIYSLFFFVSKKLGLQPKPYIQYVYYSPYLIISTPSMTCSLHHMSSWSTMMPSSIFLTPKSASTSSASITPNLSQKASRSEGVICLQTFHKLTKLINGSPMPRDQLKDTYPLFSVSR